MCALARAASDSTAHEQLFSAGVKFYLFSHCSGTLMKAGFSKVTFFTNVQVNSLKAPLFPALRGHNRFSSYFNCAKQERLWLLYSQACGVITGSRLTPI
jgi:hypothetical protein